MSKQPNWQPLVSLVGEQQAADFMWMGRVGSIELYKHCDTRRYLNIDPHGSTYAYDSTDNTYHSIPREDALRVAFS